MSDLISDIKKYFDYDPLTGVVVFKYIDYGETPTPRQKQRNTIYSGKPAGGINNGYLRTSIPFSKKDVYIHQIAFAIVKGYIPEEIDHKDLNRLNNKWNNLRESTHQLNMCNVNKRIINKSGYKGVSWSKWNSKWRMDITSNKNRYYSFHNTLEEAYEAYCKKSAELHKEFGRVE